MSNIQFLSRLKNADLHAISAESLLKNELNIEYLKYLRRYTFWDIVANKMSEIELKDKLSKIASDSYFIINPNKEEIQWDIKEWIQGDAHTVSIKVSNNHNSEQPKICEKIKDFFSVDIDSIHRSIVWKMMFNTTVPESKWKSEIVTLNPKVSGFLAHPVTEKVEQLVL